MNPRPDTLILGTDHLAPPSPDKSPFENRAAAYRMYDMPGVPKCTVAVTAYNRLDKTKTCVECILKYTKDIDYELLLVDNGSGDGTLEYFRSVPHGRKKIVRITKNIGFCYAWQAAKGSFSGKYLVIVTNDVYVTENWLKNLLICYESDSRIGFVAPVSSNVSNLQQVDIQFTDFNDMQQKAAAYNKSDPQKWEERMRCISLIGVWSRPVLDTVGLCDAAYLHDFIEDDLAIRLRRNGYRLMLCRDTWVCHDHDFSKFTGEEVAALNTRLDYGRAVFREKYHGLDAWDDILNFEREMLSCLYHHPFSDEFVKSLVIDCRCGTPVLEVRNFLRMRGFFKTETHAYTTDAKYFTDLQSVADYAQCARIESLGALHKAASFDIVALCEPVGAYPDPDAVIGAANDLLKPGGLLLYKLRGQNGVGDHIIQAIKGDGLNG